MLFCNGIKTYVPLVRFAFQIYIFSASFVPHTPFNCHFKRKWFIITIFIGEVLNNSFFCWTFVYAISIKTCNWKSYDCKVVCWTFWNEFFFHFSFDERFAHVLSIYHCDMMPLAITFFCRSSAAKCFSCASNYQQINDE